jgi:DNA-binding MarR family transcriptional regulator
MLALWEHEPRSLRDLGETVALEPGTLSPLVKRLEAAGLVVRERDGGDERMLAVRLTTAGRRMRRQAVKVPERIAARLGLDHADLEHLNVVLRDVIRAARTAPG